MAIKVPPIGTVVSLWQSRSVAATTEYKNGVQAAGSAWQAGVDNAEDEWQAGVNQAAGANAYSRGTAGKSATYVDKATNIGSSRYGAGVQAAANAYQTSMGKVLGVISNITLPPRTVVGSNQARASAVSDALHQAKLAGQI